MGLAAQPLILAAIKTCLLLSISRAQYDLMSNLGRDATIRSTRPSPCQHIQIKDQRTLRNLAAMRHVDAKRMTLLQAKRREIDEVDL